MAGHSTGPWRLDYSSIMAQFEGEEVQIASMSRTSWSQPDGGKNKRLGEQNKANGALIVVAPDLLALVEAVEWVRDETWEVCPWCGGLRGLGDHKDDCSRQQALARARGEDNEIQA